MDDLAPRTLLRNAALTALLLVQPWHSARVDGEAPGAARPGAVVAGAAARAWAGDAALVYVENDEALDASGHCPRWGYLYYSPSLGGARVWSVRAGRIVIAEDLDTRFDAPPLQPGWIDGDAALAAAEKAGGGTFRRETGGRLETMLLMRGAVSEREPDVTTWTFVYTASGTLSLYVVVNAADGRVARTWRA